MIFLFPCLLYDSMVKYEKGIDSSFSLYSLVNKHETPLKKQE